MLQSLREATSRCQSGHTQQHEAGFQPSAVARTRDHAVLVTAVGVAAGLDTFRLEILAGVGPMSSSLIWVLTENQTSLLVKMNHKKDIVVLLDG